MGGGVSPSHPLTLSLLRFRERGLTWVLDADIDDCFDSLNHELLLGLVAAEVQDEGALTLLRRWLRVGRCAQNPDRGVAQGMPISPLLCNVYLHELDRPLVRGRWALVRYADDFIVCTYSQEQAERAQALVGEILGELGLQYEPRKTRITSFDEGFTFLGVRFYRDSYSFTWEEKEVTVSGPVPRWLWGFAPEGY